VTASTPHARAVNARLRAEQARQRRAADNRQFVRALIRQKMPVLSAAIEASVALVDEDLAARSLSLPRC
jgi:hypothetical protein